MKTLITALGFLLVGPLFAGTISGFRSPAEVRELTLSAIAEWLPNPDNPTACGGGDCCPDTRANLGCTGPGAPAACCSGAGTGTCNDEACLAFSIVLDQNRTGWAPSVETQYQFDGDWFCNSFPPDFNSNRSMTCCTTVSGTPLVDVSRILSEIAGRHYAPF